MFVTPSQLFMSCIRVEVEVEVEVRWAEQRAGRAVAGAEHAQRPPAVREWTTLSGPTAVGGVRGKVLLKMLH